MSLRYKSYSFSLNPVLFAYFIDKTNELRQYNRSAVLSDLIENYLNSKTIEITLKNGVELKFTINSDDLDKTMYFLNKLTKKQQLKKVNIK